MQTAAVAAPFARAGVTIPGDPLPAAGALRTTRQWASAVLMKDAMGNWPWSVHALFIGLILLALAWNLRRLEAAVGAVLLQESANHYATKRIVAALPCQRMVPLPTCQALSDDRGANQ